MKLSNEKYNKQSKVNALKDRTMKSNFQLPASIIHLLTSGIKHPASISHILLFIALYACNPKPASQEPVHNIGILREIMHQGQYQARVLIDTLDKSNLYAVGALENLSGELTIQNGKIYGSEVFGDSIINVSHKSLKATLLVSAKNDRWDTIPAAGITSLENFITDLAIQKGLNQAFPFLVLGSADTVVHHVIRFDPEKDDLLRHREDAKHDTLTNARVMLVGFYSTKAKGIYTHHDSNMHVHVIDETTQNTGHLEMVDFGNHSVQILIPKP